MNKFMILQEPNSKPDLIIGGSDKSIMRMVADVVANNERAENILTGAEEINSLFSLLDSDGFDWELSIDGITIRVPDAQFPKAMESFPFEVLRERYGFVVQSQIK